MGMLSVAGPILYKTASAALFLLSDSASDSSLAVSQAQSIPLSNNTGTLVASYANGTVILAFNVRPPLISALGMVLKPYPSSIDCPNTCDPVVDRRPLQKPAAKFDQCNCCSSLFPAKCEWPNPLFENTADIPSLIFRNEHPLLLSTPGCAIEPQHYAD